MDAVVSAADQQRLNEAIAFASSRHAAQRRKASAVPGVEILFLSHLLQVCGLVLEFGGDIEVAMAGVLHDTIEDCGVSEEELRARFGERVARIVAACTDTLPGDTPSRRSPWQARKTRYLEHLHQADADAALVTACDKLHNLASLFDGIALEGPRFFAHLNAPAADQLWFYEGVLAALRGRVPAAVVTRFESQMAIFRRHVNASERR